jgi:seryl-tRNA synthetase
MHDIRLIRDDPAAFDAAMARRGLEPQAADLIGIDVAKRAMATEAQELLARRNEASKAIGEAMSRGARDEAEALKAEVADLKLALPAIEQREREFTSQLSDALAALPNRPADDVPDGQDEASNVELKAWGDKRRFNYAPANHVDLGPALGLDFETAAAISGARFAFLRGQMARLQRGLGQFMLDLQVANGFVECAPPLLVRDEAMFGTGQLPKFAEDSFSTNRGMDFLTDYLETHVGDGASIRDTLTAAFAADRQRRLWLIPTSEVSLTNSVREQILSADALPIRLTALTPCFRSEAGAAGKDTRGYIRQHQFEKVELVTICRPEDSEAEHEKMTLAAESVLEALDLPYRRMLLCAGDMGFSARKTYDLEVWLPGQDAYREISSVSNCGDFQARRMNARFRPEGQKGTEFVHTLNGSGLAVGRALVAVLENCQQEDGSVHLPAALHPYMGGVTRLEPTK